MAKTKPATKRPRRGPGRPKQVNNNAAADVAPIEAGTLTIAVPWLPPAPVGYQEDQVSHRGANISCTITPKQFRGLLAMWRGLGCDRQIGGQPVGTYGAVIRELLIRLADAVLAAEASQAEANTKAEAETKPAQAET